MMSKTKKLSIAFLWHMHQPVYQLTANSDYLMPWVRLHAVKDYLDMALWVDKFENLKLKFNLVPILLDAIIDYAEKGAHDLHSRMLIIPENELTDKDKTTATVNKKIMVAKVKTYDYKDVCKHIDQIIELAAKGDIHGMIFAMKEFVPEYKSMNSAFESIDKEIENEEKLPYSPNAVQPNAE